MPRPFVAVCAYRLAPGRVSEWYTGAAAVPDSYLDALRRAGVRPVLLSGPDPDDPADILGRFDGFVLVGGGDVDPLSYDAEAHSSIYGVDDSRDEFEMDLVRYAVKEAIPTLGICRGVQVLAVAMGGTLHQHVPDLSEVAHGMPVGDGDPSVHDVAVEASSRLSECIGGALLLENCVSVHHQAVAQVPPGLIVTGRSGDGLIEALETPADATGWVLGVQWHPERSAAVDPCQQAIFDGFAAAVAVPAISR